MKKLTILLLCLLCSCATTRRYRSLQTVVDSASHTVVDSIAQLQIRQHSTETKDTTIYVAGRATELTIAAIDMQPLYTASGKPVLHEFRKDTAGLHILARLNPDGSMTITATADSFLMVIHGLVRERDSIVSAMAHNRVETVQKSHVADSTTTESVTKRVGWFVVRIVIGAVIGIVLVWVSFKGKIILKFLKSIV